MKSSIISYQQGIGRHTQEETEQMGLDCLEAISDYLGEKTFLMGKDEPTLIDIALACYTSIIFYASKEDNVYKRALKERFFNLKTFTDNMLAKIYPDNWKELCEAKEEAGQAWE